MTRNYLQGKFIPRNSAKYAGDPTKIFLRSSWERKLCVWLDTHPSVLAWSSEEIVVPYYDPATGRTRRYFPDFAAKIQTEGKIERVLIEVKPLAQTRPPVQKSRVTKRFITEVSTYATNQAKWEAATKWVKQNGWDRFMVITERELKI